MSLTPKTRQHLKAKAHKLKPVVMIGGKGLTEAVKKEINIALRDHELIKLRVPTMERDDKRALVEEVCAASGAELVQLIGKICVLFKKNEE